ncbi:MAG: prepilin-type N-terminal cleavage/methylation domain-containing protein [Acidimicrobiales bacterium]
MRTLRDVDVNARVSAFTRLRKCRHSDDDGEGGFTLIELLIVVVILPLVVGAIAVGLVSVFSLQTRTSSRLGDSSDAQMVSSTFIKDVQSAQFVTTQPTSAPQCGAGSQLLGLQWSGGQTVVSYDSEANGSTNSMVRLLCTNGNTSTPSSSTIVSFDLPSGQNAPCLTIQPSTICVATTTPSWIPAAGVAAVRFNIDEPLSNFSYSLAATPRAWTPASGGGPSGGQPYAPFTLLSTSCNALSVSNNGSLSINVAGGTDNGVIAIESACPGSVTIANGATLGASTILTADPSLNSVTGGGSYPSNEYYSSTFADPFSGLAPPSSSGLPVVSCTKSGSTYRCPPGDYTTNPGFQNNSTVIFTGGGTYAFNFDFALPNGSTATFDTGTYIYNGATTSASDEVFSCGNNVTINASNVLFYSPTGSMNFGNNSVVALSPITGYDGIALWAGGNGVSVNLANNTDAQMNTYGGIYVPNGSVTDSNNGTFGTTFLVASSASFSNNTNVTITSP